MRLWQEVQALSRRPAASERLIHVVAGAVTAPDGQVLIAERPVGKQLAGHWEFPGGKLEPGETRAQGLARELGEELGIIIHDPRPLMRVRHRYDFGEVLIDLWVVSRYSGDPQGLDGQRLRWCTLDELADVEMFIADRPLIRALRLPERLCQLSTSVYVIGESPGDGRMMGQLCVTAPDARQAESNGAEFIAMSESMESDELRALSESLLVPVFGFGIAVDEARALGCSGVNDIAGTPLRLTDKL